MIIKEFRVLMNMTNEEYQVANRYSMAKTLKQETGGGEGCEVLVSESFTANEGVQPRTPLLDGRFTEGEFMHKIYHLQSKVPWFFRKLAPNGALEIHSETWNAYPYVRTIVWNPDFMNEDFLITLDTLYVADRGEQHNALNLSKEELAKRDVIYMDIATDAIQARDYKVDQDPTKYKSEKTGRGPLTRNWRKDTVPIMCCYIVVKCHFNWFGLQTIVENFIMKTERRIILNFHRNTHCWTDEWYGLTMNDVREIEKKTYEELGQQLADGGRVVGTIGDEEDI